MPHSSAPVAAATPAKRGWGCWCLASCVAVPLAIGFVALIYALWLAAASGVVRIPVLTAFAYEKHEPLRVVMAQKGTGLDLISPDALKALEKGGTDPEALDAVFGEEQMDALTKQLAKLSTGFSANRLNVDVSEGMLTASLQRTAASVKTATEQNAQEENTKKEKPVFDLAHAQIVISKAKGVEVYLPFAENPQQSSLRIYLVPSAVDGSFRLAVTDVWIGNLHVPNAWVDTFSQNTLDEALRQAAPGMKESFILTTLDVGEGNVHLEGTLAPGAL